MVITRFKPLAQTILVLICTIGITQVEAHRYGYQGHGPYRNSYHGGGYYSSHQSQLAWGLTAGLIGGAIIGSHYSRPYVYSPAPTVIYQQPFVTNPPQVIYQTLPQIVTSPTIWYFCESEKNFYPNVASCPEPWKRIQTETSAAYGHFAPPN